MYMPRTEIGYSPPTLSMPRFEIPRALPPPPAGLAVQQVEPDETNNVTLELAKESLDIRFAAPYFDNGDAITSYRYEWISKFNSTVAQKTLNAICIVLNSVQI